MFKYMYGVPDTRNTKATHVHTYVRPEKVILFLFLRKRIKQEQSRRSIPNQTTRN
jgi:hypothetical protein